MIRDRVARRSALLLPLAAVALLAGTAPPARALPDAPDTPATPAAPASMASVDSADSADAAGVTAGATAGQAPGQSALPTEVDLAYYLDALPGGDAVHDPAVPTPAEHLGFEVGAWHVRPAQLVAYMERLAEASGRVRIEETGRTHEQKPQVLVTITSEKNQARLDEILERHRRWSEPPFDGGPDAAASAASADAADLPAVVFLGYSIHGNEASGANASMVVAYHLASSRSPEVEEILDRVVVLLDPALNPDGMGRFATWANMHRGARPVADPEAREHLEDWPSGRTNHYWFDLNRDWLLLVHPESRNRVGVFQRWRPNVLADFHEMGARSTYFFQPGVPTRQNPLTPQQNLDLTRDFARYHARALDKAGSLYFTEETFDDFYFGKGSTYPDIQGTVGILFEQASARGHVQESDQGLLTFPFAIRNQAMTSLSTLQAAADKRQELLDYQRRFFEEALEEAATDPVQGYLIAEDEDPVRLHELVRVLRSHDIEVYRLARPVDAIPAPGLGLIGLGGPAGMGSLGEGAERFEPEGSFVIPGGQRQARLLRALFERRTDFADTTFYDVSAWTLPLAFDVRWAELGRPGASGRTAFSADLVGEPVAAGPVPPGAVDGLGTADPVAWAFEWTGYYAPRALERLLGKGVLTRVATRPFEAPTSGGSHPFRAGTVVVPLGLQRERAAEIRDLLDTAARLDGVVVHALTSGLTPGGVDLGSPSLRPLEEPRPMLLIGNGVSSYDAGEIWHLLDHRFGVPVSLVERSRLGRVDLDRYTHVILVDGNWDPLPDGQVDALREWVRDGGTLIGIQGGAVWAGEGLLGLGAQGGNGNGAGVLEIELGGAADAGDRPYGEHRKDQAVPLIAGTIFEARLDLTHPLAYGYTRETLPVFRDSTAILEPSDSPYETPVRYTASPLLAGYVSPENLQNLASQPAVIATRLGQGVVIRMVDNPDFRGFWYGTSKLMLNALYFGPVIDRTDVPAGVAPRH